MKKGQSIWQRLADSTDLPGETLPGMSVVELLGDSRVLVEHHRGVREYSRETIGIRLQWGILQVEGVDLELTRMTRHQLIISGVIRQLTVSRRG